MSNELRQQIHNELKLRETEDLLEIWRANDHEEWSDTAFEVIRDILSERLGEVPPQQLSDDEQDEEESYRHDGLAEWKAKLLDDENQPELYDTLEVLKLMDTINKVAIGVIVIYVLLCFSNLQVGRTLLRGIPMSISQIIKSLTKELLTILVYGLQIVVIYFPLKALSQILRILMEMEFNSRKAN